MIDTAGLASECCETTLKHLTKLTHAIGNSSNLFTSALYGNYQCSDPMHVPAYYKLRAKTTVDTFVNMV